MINNINNTNNFNKRNNAIYINKHKLKNDYKGLNTLININ